MFRMHHVNCVYLLLLYWCLGVLAWHLSFKDHLYLHLLLLYRVCECVRPPIWSLTLHTWLLGETRFFLAHLNVYSFIYLWQPWKSSPLSLCLLWQQGKSAQIYAWQQKLIRHQLTHANAYALNVFFLRARLLTNL